jgi:hypothetical protein
VNLLLDEQLDSPTEVVSRALSILGESHGLAFRALRNEAAGLQDPEIPDYCRNHDIAALVSANIRDFGARLALYEALLAAGVSVVVIRPQVKKSLSVEAQASVLAKHLRAISRYLQDMSEGPVLLRTNESQCRKVTLRGLRDEIESKRKLP